MSETQPVPHYGLHSDGDLFFLHEQNRSRCMTPGLEALQSPLDVVRHDRTTCPHSLLPMEPAMPLPWMDNELMMKLAPVPDGGAYWVPTAAKLSLVEMIPMCRPIRAVAFVPWANPVKRLVPELTVTNLAPLIIADYDTRDLREISRLLELPRTRTIILCGQLKLPSLTELSWQRNTPGIAWDLVGTSLLQNIIAQKVAEARS